MARQKEDDLDFMNEVRSEVESEFKLTNETGKAHAQHYMDVIQNRNIDTPYYRAWLEEKQKTNRFIASKHVERADEFCTPTSQIGDAKLAEGDALKEADRLTQKLIFQEEVEDNDDDVMMVMNQAKNIKQALRMDKSENFLDLMSAEKIARDMIGASADELKAKVEAELIENHKDENGYTPPQFDYSTIISNAKVLKLQKESQKKPGLLGRL